MKSTINLYEGDCLIEHENIKSGSVDLILTDLPYGIMEGQCDSKIYHNGKEKHEWDNIISTNQVMQIANRILRKNGKMILFAQQPFTNELMNKAKRACYAARDVLNNKVITDDVINTTFDVSITRLLSCN